MCLCNSVYQMYLMEKPTSRHTGRQWHNGRITQTHLLKFNGRVPRTSLGWSFWRDLLYTAVRLPKKGTNYTGFYTRGKHLANDMDDGPRHLTHTPCDTFFWQKPHHGENGSCVTKTKGLGYMYASAKRSALIYRGKYRYICVSSKVILCQW